MYFTNSSCLKMVCHRSITSSACCNRCTLAIIDKKKKKDDDSETAVEGKTNNIQPGFVAAKGSVPVKFGKKRKFEEADNLSVNVKKYKQLNCNSLQ